MDRQIKPKHVFTLLFIFWCAWLYTEIAEKRERDSFYIEVSEFMGDGARFTSDDGKALEARIKKLEQELARNGAN